MANIEITKMAVQPGTAPLTAESKPDLIVVDSVSPSLLQTKEWKALLDSLPVWYIHSGVEGEDEEGGGDFRITEHPVTRYISFQDTHIAKRTKVGSVPWGKPVISDGTSPLILAGEENGRPRLLFTFDLHQSDLPLRSEFPILVQNAVDWLGSAQGASLGRVTAGSRKEVAVSPQTVSAEWVAVDSPGASPVSLPAEKKDKAVSSSQTVPGRPGLYQFVEKTEKGQGEIRRYLEAAADPGESDFARRPELAFPGDQEGTGEEGVSYEAPAGRHAGESPYSWLPWVLLLASVVILAEWGCSGVGIQFNEPWYLLLLLPLAAFAVWAWRTYPARGGWRRRMAVPLRSLILLLLILALAGLQTVATMEQKAVYFVLDRSDSMPAGQTAGQWIQASVSAKGEKDLAGVISTGLESLVERQLSGEGTGRIAYDGKVNTQFTHLAGGLQLAGSLFPESVTPRIVLISDGEENAGDLLRQARLLQNKGIPVDVLPMAKEAGRDISIESVKVPEKIYQAEKYSLEISLNSTFAGTGELRVYEDNQELTREQVTVEKGENRFAFQSLAREPGFHRYRAEIYFADDEQAANNSGYAFSRVTGPPKVLIVEGKPGSSSNITAALTSGLIGFTIISPEMLPSELADYTGYDSLILNNVPATRISGPKMERIEQAVRDYGIGLLMVGGEDSYGLGGYFKTPIEKALPVKMELEGKREVPSLGLILVIDRSGSMGGGKLELAKEAALRTVEMLRDKDTVGVVAFDTSPWWVVEPTRLTDREKVMEQISSIQPDGGTEIYTAVDAAYQKLLKVDAQRKHIILLTDGQSATSQSYEALTGNMVQNNMTMSTVAVGDGADGQLLEYLSKLAKGRYYFTNDQSTLPAIFSRETVMMSRTYVVDQPLSRRRDSSRIGAACSGTAFRRSRRMWRPRPRNRLRRFCSVPSRIRYLSAGSTARAAAWPGRVISAASGRRTGRPGTGFPKCSAGWRNGRFPSFKLLPSRSPPGWREMKSSWT
ncbi:VWA domain-containing protein [Paenibacillus sp. CC-CFT747]|nr:VWA domain-containing protein [Paenibacillus sp. CC-CFT747]